MAGYSSGYSYRDFQDDAECIHRHFLDLRKAESSSNVIERFRDLLIDGSTYPEPGILTALHRLVASRWAEREFQFIINRCCYILINYWWSHAEPRQETVELIKLFQRTSFRPNPNPTVRRLRTLAKQFTETELYQALEDRARVVLEPDVADAHNRPLRELIPRYPYLYPHFLLAGDSSESGYEVVQQLQVQREQQFSQQLHHYTMNLLRRPMPTLQVGAAKPLPNPTLLSDDQVETAIRTYAGKSEGSRTYWDTARYFVVCSEQTASFRGVKQQMYDYLMSALQMANPTYGSHYFDRWLAEQLDSILPQYDMLQPSDALLVQTCGQLLNALVATPSPVRSNNHAIFVDLTSNLNATQTVGLLLRIALLCQKTKSNLTAIKAHLSRRFALMLRYYETKVKGEVEWLVECLENLAIAFSIHFGPSDFSWVNFL